MIAGLEPCFNTTEDHIYNFVSLLDGLADGHLLVSRIIVQTVHCQDHRSKTISSNDILKAAFDNFEKE